MMTMIKCPEVPFINCRPEVCINGKLVKTINEFYVGCKLYISKYSITYLSMFGGTPVQRVYTVTKPLMKSDENPFAYVIVDCQETNGEQNSLYYIIHEKCYTFCYRSD